MPTMSPASRVLRCIRWRSSASALSSPLGGVDQLVLLVHLDTPGVDIEQLKYVRDAPPGTAQRAAIRVRAGNGWKADQPRAALVAAEPRADPPPRYRRPSHRLPRQGSRSRSIARRVPDRQVLATVHRHRGPAPVALDPDVAANLPDLSWGTAGEADPAEDLGAGHGETV
jgi:hypothetical protein